MAQYAAQLARAEAGEQRDSHGAGLVDRHVGDEPLERLMIPDHQRDPVARGHAVLPQPVREPVRPGVPLPQGDGGVVGHVPPGDAVGKRGRQLGQQLRLEEGHADSGAPHQ